MPFLSTTVVEAKYPIQFQYDQLGELSKQELINCIHERYSTFSTKHMDSGSRIHNLIWSAV